eukprot:403336642
MEQTASQTFQLDESQELILVMIFLQEDLTSDEIYQKFDTRNKGYFSILDFTKILNAEYNIKPTVAFNLFKTLDQESIGKITNQTFLNLISYLNQLVVYKPMLSDRKREFSQKNSVKNLIGMEDNSRTQVQTPKRFQESPCSNMNDDRRQSYRRMKFPKIESSPRLKEDKEFLSNQKLSSKKRDLLNLDKDNSENLSSGGKQESQEYLNGDFNERYDAMGTEDHRDFIDKLQNDYLYEYQGSIDHRSNQQDDEISSISNNQNMNIDQIRVEDRQRIIQNENGVSQQFLLSSQNNSFHSSQQSLPDRGGSYSNHHKIFHINQNESLSNFSNKNQPSQYTKQNLRQYISPKIRSAMDCRQDSDRFSPHQQVQVEYIQDRDEFPYQSRDLLASEGMTPQNEENHDQSSHQIITYRQSLVSPADNNQNYLQMHLENYQNDQYADHDDQLSDSYMTDSNRQSSMKLIQIKEQQSPDNNLRNKHLSNLNEFQVGKEIGRNGNLRQFIEKEIELQLGGMQQKKTTFLMAENKYTQALEKKTYNIELQGSDQKANQRLSFLKRDIMSSDQKNVKPYRASKESSMNREERYFNLNTNQLGLKFHDSQAGSRQISSEKIQLKTYQNFKESLLNSQTKNQAFKIGRDSKLQQNVPNSPLLSLKQKYQKNFEQLMPQQNLYNNSKIDKLKLKLEESLSQSKKDTVSNMKLSVLQGSIEKHQNNTFRSKINHQSSNQQSQLAFAISKCERLRDQIVGMMGQNSSIAFHQSSMNSGRFTNQQISNRSNEKHPSDYQSTKNLNLLRKVELLSSRIGMTPPSNVGSNCKTSKYQVKTALLDMGNTMDSYRELTHKINAATLQNSEGVPYKYHSKIDFNFDKEDNLKLSLRKDSNKMQSKVSSINNSTNNNDFFIKSKLSQYDIKDSMLSSRFDVKRQSGVGANFSNGFSSNGNSFQTSTTLNFKSSIHNSNGGISSKLSYYNNSGLASSSLNYNQSSKHMQQSKISRCD